MMGSRLGFVTPCDLLIPVHSRCKSSSFVGSSSPLSKCSSRIPARYTLIVLCMKPGKPCSSKNIVR